MKTEKNTLPEKCCANCGYLYGYSRYGIYRDEVIFDPDLIREADYPQSSLNADDETFRGLISRSFYTLKYERVDGERIEAIGYTWADTSFICCNWRVFQPKHISEMRDDFNFRENAKHYLPLESISLLDEIRQDRINCPHFYPYHPGYSAKEHIELQIQELRHKNNLDTQRYLMDQEIKFEDRWKQHEIKITIIFGIFTAIFALLQIVALLVVGN